LWATASGQIVCTIAAVLPGDGGRIPAGLCGLIVDLDPAFAEARARADSGVAS
jgi:hypothetical protein